MYFFKKHKNRILVSLVVIVLIVIIGTTNKKNYKVSEAENLFASIISPINGFFYSIGNKISYSFENIGNFFNEASDKEKLEIEILKLKDENRELQNIIGKSEFLKAEKELLETTDLNLIPAQVTSKEPGNWYNKFKINKGKKDGIEKGTIIIQGIKSDDKLIQEGLVGRVIKVGDNWATVASMIDEQASVSFKSIRTQDGGMINGSIDSDIEGYLFDRNADVVAGDELYTSGLGQGYREDLYIGEIEEVILLEEELMKKIVVKPAIDFKKIYKVFAIIE